ncbi:MAG: phosphotransferase [Candidatus Heimdallarchaeota archaeon]|nr:phosphotransferase [Candidatus Heimdallarchaeota archaeon]MCK5047782.1 phosphotransferase [Candidatus Heimdallarchaeota archaeon]
MNQSEQIINIVSRWGFKPNELEKITSGNTYTQVYLLSDPTSKRLFCFRGNKGNKQSKGNQVTFVHAVQNYLFNSRLIESRAIRNGEGESWLEEEGYLWELLSWAKGEAVMRDQLNTLQTTDYYNLGVYVGQIHNKLYSFTKEKEITKTPLLDLPYENMILFEQENAKNLIAIVNEAEEEREESSGFDLLTPEEQVVITSLVHSLNNELQKTATQNFEAWGETGVEGVIHRDMRLEHFLFSEESIYLIDWSFTRWGYFLEDVSRVLLEFEILEEEHLKAFIEGYCSEFPNINSELMILPELVRFNAIRGGSWALNRLLQPITPELRISKETADIYLRLFSKMTSKESMDSLKSFFEKI